MTRQSRPLSLAAAIETLETSGRLSIGPRAVSERHLLSVARWIIERAPMLIRLGAAFAVGLSFDLLGALLLSAVGKVPAKEASVKR